jgi:hypothetical protein
VLSNEGYVRVASNGGLFVVTITPRVGASSTGLFGPTPVRQVFGPFAEGATVAITNQSAASLDYTGSSNSFFEPIPSMLWAARPSASQVGSQFIFSDVGGGNPGPSGGNVFFWNGNRFKPMNGNCLLDAIDTANSGLANTAEQQLNPNRVAVPAGVVSDFDRLRLWFSASKNGASDTCTHRVRWGPLGTTSDPVIATITALAGANQSYGTLMEFKRLSATTVQKQGNADPSSNYGGASAGAYPAAVTVSNMDTNAMFLTLSAQMTGGTEIPTVNDYTLELWASDNA